MSHTYQWVDYKGKPAFIYEHSGFVYRLEIPNGKHGKHLDYDIVCASEMKLIDEPKFDIRTKVLYIGLDLPHIKQNQIATVIGYMKSNVYSYKIQTENSELYEIVTPFDIVEVNY